MSESQRTKGRKLPKQGFGQTAVLVERLVPSLMTNVKLENCVNKVSTQLAKTFPVQPVVKALGKELLTVTEPAHSVLRSNIPL